MTIFYDFDITPQKRVIETLEKFGFSGACIFFDSKDFNEKSIEKFNRLNENSSLDLHYGICIKERNANNMRKLVQKFSRTVDLIMVYGGDAQINRSACEMPQVSILAHPYLNKRNSGMNHVLANMAYENNITISIDYRHLLANRGYYKAKMINQVNQLLLLQKKYKFRTLLTSGSSNFYDVRSPRSMILLSQMLDMDINEAKKAITTNPQEILNDVKRRKNSIVDGVMIIDKE
jgi:ribonuclease P/MRP protein subunit RPP1